MAEGQRGTTLQCMAVCVCGPNMGGVWLDGGCFVTITNANTTQLMGFVAMTAPHSPAVSHQHTDVCVFVWQSLLCRVCLVVSIWQVSCCPQQSHGVPCCRWADAPQPLLPFAAAGASLWAGHPVRLAPHVFVCVEWFGFGNKQAHKHTTCGNTTCVGALLVSWQHNLPQVHWCRHPGEMALCVCGCTPRPCVCTRPTHHITHTVLCGLDKLF